MVPSLLSSGKGGSLPLLRKIKAEVPHTIKQEENIGSFLYQNKGEDGSFSHVCERKERLVPLTELHTQTRESPKFVARFTYELLLIILTENKLS